MFKDLIKYGDKIDANNKHHSTFKIIVDAWDKEKPINSPIKTYNSFEYSFRILNILKNELKVQSPTIVAATLSLYEIIYSKNLSNIDEGILQISKDYHAVRSLPVENIKQHSDKYRAMVLNVANDMRAIIINIAINVFELRNINNYDNNFPNLKRKSDDIIALSKYVYIPIAHRLGFYKLKSGMEDLVLKHEHPNAYSLIVNKLKENEKEREKIIEKFTAPIRNELKSQGLKFKIKGRTKSIHSIYSKMQAQHVEFERVYDLWAIRIIINSKSKPININEEKAVCWQAFSVITNLYEPNLSRMRDWISVPRDNGYESLHITVATKDKRWVEVQIRTERMDDEAENGMAAHWRYKGGKAKFGIDFWLDNIKSALEKDDELLGKNEFKSGKFSTELFAFTPKGDLKKLNIGASVLDFAFAIHTEVGFSCVGAIVNGKNVGIKHQLRNGDQIKILTSKSQKPSMDWLKIVNSSRAKLRIRRAFDKEVKIEADFGKEILLRKLKSWKVPFSQDVLEELISYFKFKTIAELYRAFYNQKISLPEVKRLLLKQDEQAPQEVKIEEKENNNTDIETELDDSDLLFVDNMSNVNYTLAKCCNPIPGNKIFGFVTVSKGISIHRNNCPNAKDLKERYEYRIIDAVWKE